MNNISESNNVIGYGYHNNYSFFIVIVLVVIVISLCLICRIFEVSNFNDCTAVENNKDTIVNDDKDNEDVNIWESTKNTSSNKTNKGFEFDTLFSLKDSDK